MSKASEMKHVYWFRAELNGSRNSCARSAAYIRQDIRRSGGAADVQMFTDQELMGMIEHGIHEASAGTCTETAASSASGRKGADA